jgi:pantoate--beta-alanine ligase
MRIIESIDEMREYSQQCKRDGKTIASVDIASFIHKGHMQLVEIAKQHSDIVIVSFGHSIEFLDMYKTGFNTVGDGSINPTWDKFIVDYQRDIYSNDIKLCNEHKVDIFFSPPMSHFYEKVSNTVILSPLPFAQTMKKNYPEFSQVAPLLIRAYLISFNIVSPDIAVVGQKDITQSFTLKKIINDLKYPIKLIIAPTHRESNGLAFNSRNRYLTPSERQDATSIYQTLHEISRWDTYPPIPKIKEHICNRIEGNVNYVLIVSTKTLEDLSDLVEEEIIILVEVSYENTTLTDNIIIKPQGIK